MTTSAFSADAVNLFVGTVPDANSAPVSIQMKTKKFYTDGSALQTGQTYPVTADWAQMAVDNGWAKDVNGVLPNQQTPKTLSAALAAAMASGGVGGMYKRPGRKATRQVATIQDAIANGVTGWCYHNNITVEGDIVAIRLLLNNVHTSNLTNITYALAPTADFSSQITPTGAWINGTGGSGATGVVTAAAQFAAATSPGPYASPSMTRTDWMQVATVAPTDGTSKRYLMLRHFVPAASNGTTSEGHYALNTFWHNASAANGGRVFQTFRQDVDGITTKANFTSTTPYAKPGLVMGWEYILASGEIRTVAGSGDSILEGAVNGAAGNFGNGWLWQSINAFRAAYPSVLVEHANYGMSSTLSAQYQALAIERIGRIDADLLVYSPFSGNDGAPTVSILNAQVVQNASLQTTARLWNTPVMYVAGCPNTVLGWTAPQDAIRRYGNVFFIGDRMSRAFVQMDPDLWDGVSAFKTGVSTDGAHPNEYGAALVAANYGLPALHQMVLGY